MTTRSKFTRICERWLLTLGLVLIFLFAFAHLDRFVMLRAEMRQFDAQKLKAATGHNSTTIGNDIATRALVHPLAQNTDYLLWSIQRIKSYEATLGVPIEPLAILRIPKLHMEAPVLDGTDAVTLNRGVGRITGTSLPGHDGNIGIAGHRDGFFRGLKDISAGDEIELVMTSGTDLYVVNRVWITDPKDISILRPGTQRSLTLVTCYPFHFVGPAPKRFIVEATLKR
jgi:sortase A